MPVPPVPDEGQLPGFDRIAASVWEVHCIKDGNPRGLTQEESRALLWRHCFMYIERGDGATFYSQASDQDVQSTQPQEGI